jgi:L-aminopeptidase/D-esterase-like protein
METIRIEDIPGFSFGQVQSMEAGTGCTVILCPSGAVCGVDVRGGSPSTRDTDALDPRCNREVVHAVLLTGGSAFGLDAAGGVMKKLEEARIGRDVLVTVVPNVCAAVLFDLKCGHGDIRPDAAMGYAACEAALQGPPFQNGCFGAGTGATLGKVLGIERAMKGGIGAAAFRQGELMVGAVVAVNCVGDVWEGSRILVGCRAEDGITLADGEQALLEGYPRQRDVFSGRFAGEDNTVIGCIVTNAVLTKAQAGKLAAVGHNGLARAIRPAHTTFDGDTLFAMSCGGVSADPDAVGILAAKAVEEAILTGVRAATTMHGLPAWKDLYNQR